MARSAFHQRGRFMSEARALYDNGGDARRAVQLVKLAWVAHRTTMWRRAGGSPQQELR